MMEPDNPLLDDYILRQSGKDNPKVCFIPTAGSEDRWNITNFYEIFLAKNTKPAWFSFFKPQTADMEDFFLSQDVIYVGGGNTKTMLAIWQEWEMDVILRKAYQQGVVLAGLSAGAICWFEQGLTDSVPGQYTRLDCLGFLAGSCAPHYDVEGQRRPRMHELIKNGELLPGYGIDDSCAIHFMDGEINRVVSSIPGKAAYRVFLDGDTVIEEKIDGKFLGS